jgi:hypothetical protein
LSLSRPGAAVALVSLCCLSVGCGGLASDGSARIGGDGQVTVLDAGNAGNDRPPGQGTGGADGGTDTASNVDSGGAGGASGGCETGDAVPDPDLLAQAADFEINSEGAQNAYLDCDPTRLTANMSILDGNGNSWGPATLGSQGQKVAFANLLRGIFRSVGTSDLPGPGPGGSVGLHGWPDLAPRITGAATNGNNDGPGTKAYLGGLLGFGANPSAIIAGTFNGELVDLYKAAAIADGLKDASGTALRLTSSNTAFGSAISPVETNPTTAIGLADNIAQCAFAISLGVDADGVVLANPTTFTKNVVERLFDYACGGDSAGTGGKADSDSGTGGAAVAGTGGSGSGSGSGGSATGETGSGGGAETGGSGSGGSEAGGSSGAGGVGGAAGAGGAGGNAGGAGQAAGGNAGGGAGVAGQAAGGNAGGAGSGNGGAGGAGTAGAGSGGTPRCPDLDHNTVPDCQETLVSNSTFDDATTGWTPAPGSAASFTSVDGSGSPASGAIAVTNLDTTPADATNGWTATGAFQCIPITAGLPYAVDVQVFIPANQGSGWAGFQIDYYLAPGCAGATATYPFVSPQVTSTGAWQVISTTTPQLPLGVTSVAVRLVVGKPVAQASQEAFFDSVLVRVN